MGLLTATHALVLLIVLIPVLGAHVLYSEALHGKRFGRELSAVREEGPVVTLAYDRAGADANDHAADVEMLQRTYEETLNAWCNSDGSRYGAAFAENANYVSFDGSVTRGRKEIAQSHEELFTKWLKGSCLVGAIKEIQFTSRNSAVLLVYGGTVFDGHIDKVRRPSIQTYTAVRSDDSWHFQSFQNQRVKELTAIDYMILGIKTSLFRM